MEIKDSFDEIFSDIKRILIVLAHPDDMEIVCGGTIARLTSQNKQVRLVVTTNGSKGTKEKNISEEDFSSQRISEQLSAGKILGISREQNFNLNIPDGELENNVDNIEKIVLHLREFQPEIVITHNPDDHLIIFNNTSHWVNHRDHRHTGSIALDAVYPYSRDRGFFPDQLNKHQLSPCGVNKILLSDSYTKDYLKYFSIDNFLEQKRKALKQHISAFDPSTVDDYIDENEINGSYFEPLGFLKVY